MATTDAAALDFFNPPDRSNPYPLYRRILEENPVSDGPMGAKVFARYADCSAILRDPRSSSDERKGTMYKAMVQGGMVTEVENDTGRPFLFLDPPDHTRLRGLVQKAFTPRVVEALRPRVQQMVDDLIDSAAQKGSMEVIDDFAYPLPVVIISELLGVPPDDHETFKGWSQDLARSLDPDFMLPPDVIERRAVALSEFQAYFRGLIDVRREKPGDDLLSALIVAEEEGAQLTNDELLSTCGLLLVAGHETTVNLIANGVLNLIRHPDQLAAMRADPSLAKSGIEEVLRFDPPVHLTGRTILEPYEVGGTKLEEGSQVILLLAAANRDPAQFDEPDRFDLARSDNRHLAFGFGTHFCLGAPLARVEGQIALTTFARRVLDPALATDPPPYKDNFVLRGMSELPVVFSGVAAPA